MTISRPSKARREGRGKKTPPFVPSTIMVRSFHAPWGDLCAELFKFHGQGHRRADYDVTHSDLIPQGGTFLVFETEECFL
jgi:hypothetical protein